MIVYGRDGECLGALVVQMPLDNSNGHRDRPEHLGGVEGWQ